MHEDISNNQLNGKVKAQWITKQQLIKAQYIQNGKTIIKFTIGKYQYFDSDYLGEGFSSRVYKANPIGRKREKFAIKVIDLSKFDADEMQLLETQVEIISKLNHPNVIKFSDVYKTQQNIFLVTQYCPHGDLNQLIRFQDYITQDKAISIMKQIIDGYKYLLSKNIIHRDLKPANIMRFGTQWKIGDFGFAKYCKQQFSIEKMYLGTPLYMPPQTLQFNKYSYKSDLFALGVIFYEVLTGSTPWQAKDQKQLLQSMEKNKFISPPFIVSTQIKYFLQKCLQYDFYDRMNKNQLANFTLDKIDVQRVAKIRPGRGISPAIKRQLSKSGKKSCIFNTQLKIINSNLFSGQKSAQVLSINTPKKKQKAENVKNLMQKNFDDYGLMKNAPSIGGIYKQNFEIMNNEVEMVKIMKTLTTTCKIFILKNEQEILLNLLMYLLGLKMLKMVTNKRQNFYKFKKWEVFRECDEYKINVSQIFNFITKIETQLKAYKETIKSQKVDQFNQQFPELVAIGPITFKTYIKIFNRLKKLIIKNVAYSEYQVEESLNKKCFSIKILTQIIKMLKNRITRQQQIRGYGINSKPNCLSLKNVSWSSQAYKFSIKQLHNLCKQKVEIGQPFA